MSLPTVARKPFFAFSSAILVIDCVVAGVGGGGGRSAIPDAAPYRLESVAGVGVMAVSTRVWAMARTRPAGPAALSACVEA
jgi:hypothetical protein